MELNKRLFLTHRAEEGKKDNGLLGLPHSCNGDWPSTLTVACSSLLIGRALASSSLSEVSEMSVSGHVSEGGTETAGRCLEEVAGGQQGPEGRQLCGAAWSVDVRSVGRGHSFEVGRGAGIGQWFWTAQIMETIETWPAHPDKRI